MIIFDLDGTLLDTSEGSIKSIDFTIKRMGYAPISEETKRSFIGPPIFNSLQSTYHLSDDEAHKATEVFREAYKHKFLYEARIYDGIVPLLQTLCDKGYILAVASYKRDDYCKMLVQYFGLDVYFQCVLGSDSNNTLTKADIIRQCMQECNNTQAQNTLLVGDSAHDALGAQTLGLDFIAVTYGFGFKKGEAIPYPHKGCVNTPIEVLDYIT